MITPPSVWPIQLSGAANMPEPKHNEVEECLGLGSAHTGTGQACIANGSRQSSGSSATTRTVLSCIVPNQTIVKRKNHEHVFCRKNMR
jgi:hypothetical protein